VNYLLFNEQMGMRTNTSTCFASAARSRALPERARIAQSDICYHVGLLARIGVYTYLLGATSFHRRQHHENENQLIFNFDDAVSG
jgi:hypothetical protein